MSKPILGLVLGSVLGIFDGLTALFTPEVAPFILGIVIGSTIKGLIAGIAIGFFARKANSLPLGIIFGFAVGLLLAYAVAAMPSETGQHYYFEIMLPGSILGIIVGFATQKYGMRRKLGWADLIAATVATILFLSGLHVIVGRWSITALVLVVGVVVVYCMNLALDSLNKADSKNPQKISSEH
jgi:hypothetical protein